MDLAEYQPILRLGLNLGILAGLVVILIGLITWMGIIPCSSIPGWCEVYWGVLGAPDILILHGDDGMGDVSQLAMILRDPTKSNVQAITRHYKYMGLENMRSYDLIIVTHARTLPTDKMLDLMTYIDMGGRIIWVGDAGTNLPNNEITQDYYLYKNEVDSTESHEIISPWARKINCDSCAQKGTIVNLHNYISVDYVGKFCDSYDCRNNTVMSGQLVPTSTDDRFTYAFQSHQQYYGDLALVESIPGIGTKIILSMDAQLPIVVTDGNKQTDLGTTVPVIVSSGALGAKVVYYAIPPEEFVSEQWANGKNNMPSLVENMISGMFR